MGLWILSKIRVVGKGMTFLGEARERPNKTCSQILGS